MSYYEIYIRNGQDYYMEMFESLTDYDLAHRVDELKEKYKGRLTVNYIQCRGCIDGSYDREDHLHPAGCLYSESEESEEYEQFDE